MSAEPKDAVREAFQLPSHSSLRKTLHQRDASKRSAQGLMRPVVVQKSE